MLGPAERERLTDNIAGSLSQAQDFIVKVRPSLLPHRRGLLWRETVVDGGDAVRSCPLQPCPRNTSLCARRVTFAPSHDPPAPVSPSPPHHLASSSAQRAIANLSAVDANYGRMVQQKVARIKVGLGHPDRLSHQTAVLYQNSH